MYLIVGIVISLCALFELIDKRENRKYVFRMVSVLLTGLLCFRYGQGTDYWAYKQQYNYTRADASLWINELYHGELGWHIIMVLFKRIGFSFEMFIGLISLLMMILTIKFIDKYSPYKCLSLLLLYPTYYLTYYSSALRQGLVLAAFLGIGLDLLQRKEWLKYCCLILLLVFVHSSTAILFILPFVSRWQGKKPGKWLIVAFVFAVICGYSGILKLVANFIGISDYFNVSISYSAIILRAMLFFFIYYLNKCSKPYRKDRIITSLYSYYTLGFVIYIMLAFSSTLSQRLTMPMKAIEIVLVPLLCYEIYEMKKNGSVPKNKVLYIRYGKYSMLLFGLIIVIMLDVELVKNIGSYITQGEYKEGITIMNYPYISIFDKDNIFEYSNYVN